MKLLLLYLGFVGLSNCQNSHTTQNQNSQIQAQACTMDKNINSSESKLDTATFGAGCFWCVEAVFQDLNGVEKVVSGYAGGQVKNPSYREVCMGTTGHAEVVQIYFDPAKISFNELLEVFWTTHDPTTLNRQGADRGTQYRSVIFYHNDDQKMRAEKSKAEVAAPLWDDPVVTEISPMSEFYIAEDYHQNYFNENGEAPYCQIVIAPKIAKLKNKFAHKLKSK